MAIIASAGSDSTTHTPAPAGTHQAVCVDVIDKGMVETTWEGKKKMQHKIAIAWQIDELRDDGKRFVLYRRYTLSLNEKASLRKDLESWRGRAFTRDEEMGFDVESVIGANCLINIQHNKSGEKTYANVVSVMPLLKGMPKLAAEDYSRDEATTAADHADTQAQPEPSDASNEPPDLTDDDIPFAWLMPLLLPVSGLLGLGSYVA